MKRFVYFLLVGFAFTAFQASVAGAQGNANQQNQGMTLQSQEQQMQQNQGNPNENMNQGNPNQGNPNENMNQGNPNQNMNQGNPNENMNQGNPRGPNDHMRGGPNDHRGPGMAPPPLDCPPGSGNPLCASPQGSAQNPGMTSGPGGHNDGPREAMDMSPRAIEERCKGAPTDAERANCVAANNRMNRHDGPRDGTQGDRHDGPPMDPRSGQPFTQADEIKFQRFADECEATRGLLSEGSTQELVKEGFTRIQVEKLCKDGPEQRSGGGHVSGDASGTLPTADDSARPIGEGGEGGGPAAHDMSGKMINDGGHGANSAADAEEEKAEAMDVCLTKSCVGVSPEYGGPEGCKKLDLTIRQCKAEVFGGHSNDYK